MDLRIMSEWFKVPYPFHDISKGLLVNNPSCIEGYTHTKTTLDKALQNLNLDLSHNPRLNFLQLLIPDNMKFRLFFFKLAELRKHYSWVTTFGQNNLIGQHGFQYRCS